jgi:hypothetical protein
MAQVRFQARPFGPASAKALAERGFLGYASRQCAMGKGA